MPFGLIFGAIFFGFLSPWLAVGFLRVPWWPARVGGALLLVLGPAIAIGLVFRRPMARWSGSVTAALLTALTTIVAVSRGEVMDFLLMFASAATLILLLLPITGDVGRGLAAGALPAPRVARLAAGVSLIAACGLALVGAWAVVADGPRWSHTAAPAAPLVQWMEFGPGMERARAEGKPVFVDFYAEWCGPCKQMDRTTFRDPEVVRRLDNIVAVRVDSEEVEPRHGFSGAELAEKYGVGSYPTVALLDPGGNLVSKLRGFQGPAPFIVWLETAVEESRQTGVPSGVGAPAAGDES